MTDSPLPSLSSLGTGDILAQTIIQKLPEIISSFKDVYALRTKEEAFKAALNARCAELEINSQNFSTLVQALTELSKGDGSDEETKAMFRDMIRTLFTLFASRASESSAFSSFMDR